MAAALQIRLRNDDPIQTLQVRLATLEKEHEGMQNEYKRLYLYHGKQCAASLQDCMKSLFEVIVSVRKADKNLVDWHYRSSGLKSALRIFGLDRRTHVVIEKKTQKLQDKVQRVEKKFDQAGLVFDDGLREAKRLRSGFLDFSTGDVEKVSQEVSSTRDAYDQEYERVDAQVKQQSAEHENAQSKADNLVKLLDDTKRSHENAEWARATWGVGALAGFGVAAVSAWLFPPSLISAAPLLAASVAAGRTMLSYNDQVQDLQAQEQSLASAVSNHGTTLRGMKAELANSSHNLNACSEILAKVDEFQRKSETFRAESQMSLNELYVVQTVLDKTREKLRIISKELHECRYEESRRGIAGRLRDVLAAIETVPQKVKSTKAVDIKKATLMLTEIDEKTEEVLHIVIWSAQTSST